MDAFEIGTARVLPGERAYGEVRVTRRMDGTPVAIPIILVRGRQAGPILCINGGVHGDEFAGMEAVVRIAHDVDPEELRGTLVAVPVVNQPAFEDASRVNHYDHKDLNRTFPGSPDGTLSQKIAHAYFESVVRRCDALVDLHGAGGYASINNIVIAQGGYEELVEDLALATGFDLVWRGGPWGGTVRLTALEAGIPAITVEAGGGMDSKPEDVEIHLRAVTGVMRHLRMLDGRAEYPRTYTVMTGGTTYASRGGVFRPRTASGARVHAGDLLALVTDLHGRTIEELRASEDGVVCELRQAPAIQPGEAVVILGRVIEEREHRP